MAVKTFYSQLNRLEFMVGQQEIVIDSFPYDAPTDTIAWLLEHDFGVLLGITGLPFFGRGVFGAGVFGVGV